MYDTDDSSNQKVSIDEIIKALKLGINIQGVYLNSNNSLEVYDFVNSNIQRLQSFGICSYDVKSTDITLTNFGLQIASLILPNQVRHLKLTGDGYFILDSFYPIQSIRGVYLSGNACLDLTHIDEYTLEQISKRIHFSGSFGVGIMLSVLANNRIRVKHDLEEKLFEYFWLYNLDRRSFEYRVEADYFKLVTLLKPYRQVAENYLMGEYTESYILEQAEEVLYRIATMGSDFFEGNFKAVHIYIKCFISYSETIL